MRRLVLGALLLAWVVPVAPAAPEGDELDPVASIRAAEFLAHVKWLADDARGGRLTGSPDERAATQYVADRFHEWGLVPAGEDGGYFQYFPAPTRLVPGDANRCRLGDRALTAGIDFRPLGLAPTTQATGRLVFVGYGISDPVYDDYAGVDVRGAMAVAIRVTAEARPPGVKIEGPGMFLQNMLTQRQVQSAENAGAVGLLLVPSAHAPDELGVVSGGGRLARFFSKQKPTIPVAIVTHAAMEPLLVAAGVDTDAFEEAAHATRAPAERRALGADGLLATEVVEQEFQGRNVIGLVEGADPVLKDQYVVIGAHADHVGHNEAGNATDGTFEIHNGADDNASGTAGMLELAQAFATCAFRPARSVLFMAFSGEELGLLGSAAWVRHPTRPLGQVVAMINLDMIGRGVNGRVTAESVESSPGFKALCERHNRTIGLDLHFTKGVRPDSDHFSFYRGHVPVIFFFTGLHTDYHKATDDWDKINAECAEKTLRLTFLCAAELTATPERPAYTDIPVMDRGRPGRGGDRVRLGIMPDFEFSGVGAKAGQVLPGTPAAKAGIQTGDVLVRIGERDIANMQDLSDALRAHKPGDTTAIVVVRDGERRTLQVTFEAR